MKNSKQNRLVVQKYGGTSLASIKKIKDVALRISKYKKNGDNVVVVVSAMGDTTERLISLAKQVNTNFLAREMDMLLSTGEQVSAALLTLALHAKGLDAISFTGSQVGILTDSLHSKAKIIKIEADCVNDALKKGKVVVITGFQGKTIQNEIVTLGRGGSDLSAVALGSVLAADICEIYTDVDGIYTADPRIVKQARKLDYISFDEMLELASRGAQVMQTRAVEVAKKYNISLHVRSSFSNKEGTIIMNKKTSLEASEVKGIAITEKEAKLTVCGVPDTPGMVAKIFEDLTKSQVNIDMIVQNVSHNNTTDVSFTVDKVELKKAFTAAEKVVKKIKAKTVLCNENIAKISIVGLGMKSHCGVAYKVFKTLADLKINVDMISTSEISISCVIKKKDGKRAVIELHKIFKLHSK